MVRRGGNLDVADAILVADFVEKENDSFYPLSNWPEWAKTSFVNSHKDRNARFKLFVFFWKNGMEPYRAAHWTIGWHNRHGFPYDQAAMRQVNELVQAAQMMRGRQYAYMWRMPVLDIQERRLHPQPGLDTYQGLDKDDSSRGFTIRNGWPVL